MMKSITREKVFHVLKLVLLAVTVTLVLLSLLGTVAHASGPVSYTHLDVYKRQIVDNPEKFTLEME